MSSAVTVTLTLAALAAAGAGFCALSLAMSRHWEGLYGRGSEPTPRQLRALRTLGSAALLLSLLLCLSLWGSAQGWVAWAGMLTFAALGLALALSYAATALLRVSLGAAGITLAMLLAAALARLMG